MFKKGISKLLVIASLLLLPSFAASCSSEASGPKATQPTSTEATAVNPGANEGAPIKFKDPVFEKLLKAELKKDSITSKDLDTFTRIIIGGDHFISLSGGPVPEKSIALFFGEEVELEGVRYKGFGTMKSLEDLSNFKNLTVLNVTLQPEIDYSTIPAETISKLQRVFLTQSKIKDISFLSGATKMFSLSLSSNEIEDLSPLKSCTELLYIGGNSNKVQDLSPLSGLTKLKSITFYENQIKDLTPLSGLTNLESLELYSNVVEDLTPLAGLSNLKELELINNKVKDVSPLKGFKSFESLRLNGNPIENINELDHIENLEFK